VRLHGACQQQVSTLIAFLHCDLVRKAFVAKLGVRLQIRAKSLYQLFEVIQFLKLLNPFVRGQFSLGQTLHQVIALGQKDTSPTPSRSLDSIEATAADPDPTHGPQAGTGTRIDPDWASCT
jgi:hypothetical protein